MRGGVHLNKSNTYIAKYSASAFLSLVLFCSFLLPHTALSQTNPCTISERGIFNDSDNTFKEDPAGIDFKITCSGDLVDDISVGSLTAIPKIASVLKDFRDGKSKLIIDVSGDSSKIHEVWLASDSAKVIFTGTIENDATQTDRGVVGFGAADPATNDGVKFDVDVELDATITARGDGRGGVSVYTEHGESVTVTNRGTILTEGEGYTRPPDRNWRNRRANGLVFGIEGTGTGNATAVNEVGATVTVKGEGARGISGYIDSNNKGNVTITNKGTVTTEGEIWVAPSDGRRYTAFGLSASNEGGGAATVSNSGTVSTRGERANGLNASTSSSGAATASNSGSVSTRGERAYGLNSSTSGGGAVTVSNSGAVTTRGERAYGMSAWVSGNDNSSSFSVTGTNSGSITTKGDSADGASIFSYISTNSASRASVSNSGMITTNGNNAEGIEVGFWYPQNSDGTDSNALGIVTATNSGTITTKGDSVDDEGNPENDLLVSAVSAGFYAASDFLNYPNAKNEILHGGDAVVANTGTVNAIGNRRIGLYALTHGTGTTRITSSGGAITAGSDNSKFGIGIFGEVNTKTHSGSSTDDSSTDQDVIIVVDGTGTTVKAFGAAADVSGTTDYDESKGIGILAKADGSSGHSHVTVSGGASVSAFGANSGSGYAAMFESGKGTLNITDSTMVGDVKFANVAGNTLNVEGTSSIVGNVDFGTGGSSTMSVNTAASKIFGMMGSITGLSTMNKTGKGAAIFYDDVTFASSTLNLNDGDLIIRGHLNLGDGTITVKEVAKLKLEVNKQGEVGSVTAGTMNLNGDMYIQLSNDSDADTRTQLVSSSHQVLNVANVSHNGSPATSLDVKSETADDSSVTVGTIALSDGTGTLTVQSDKANQIAAWGYREPTSSSPRPDTANPRTPPPTTDPGTPPPTTDPGTPPPAAKGTSGSSGSGVIGLGLLALLLTQHWDTDDEAEASFGTHYFGTPRPAYIAEADERGMLTFMETGDQPYRMWARTSQSGYPIRIADLSSGVSAVGNEVGMSWQGDEGFHVGASVVSRLSASDESLNMSANGRGYSINGGWRNDRYFTGLRLSQSAFETNSVIDNPVVNSALVSNADVSNTQVQFRAGMNFTADKVRITPSMSIQAGTFKQGSHEAHSPVLTAMVPGFSQDYASVRLGLKLSATDWLSLSDSVKWKPRMQFDSIHTRSYGAKRLTVHQSDRAGVMGFSTNSGIRSLPEVINSASFMAGIKSSRSPNAAWKFGFAGIEADGQVEFATAVGYQLKF